ncbi:ROK family transcriptional regulator [Goodfellowiella coeruleoviolacea]|uniref:Sugar kinase of the NBD/HSP70 family, may containing an N-terminal HTH domain n=1 Tax=Goodfellowiella coeruleoviolacea TaxID=334858 RepID=A0AAE3GJ55_9PSEU|nr:ROK family transcriptional regulator [Goodfellowiella coeruleoviolacea]MCP2168279.1 Sugar kinase of the NBD/HSP70 family, may containing an N-terminal HTH domain [Goodfellowiella coeruleoviolacea]
MANTRARPADAAGPRRANLALLLRTLQHHGPASRARLAVLAGLSKATVSQLVADLVARRLVRLGGAAAGGAGRPGQLVELRPAAVCGIGLDIAADHLGAVALDLTGAVVARRWLARDVPALAPDRALDELAAVAEATAAEVAGAGGWVAGLTVATPGLVDVDSGVVRLAATLRWREVAVADALAARTGVGLDRIAVDNDANLGALAEHARAGQSPDHRPAAPDRPETSTVDDLLYLSGGVGVGGGLVANGELVRGAFGFAGEVGHMSLDPMGPYCSCGRRGCWETQVGVRALVHAAAMPDDPIRDPLLGVEQRLEVIRSRVRAGDRRTVAALQQIGSALGAGVAILVNALNPAQVVLGGYFAALHDWLVEPVRIEMASRVLAPEAASTPVVAARFGFDAARRGGAYAALRRVVDDPTLAPVSAEQATEAPA